MERKRPEPPDHLSDRQSNIAVSFYDAACDFPGASFDEIRKRLLPRGFGSSQTSLAFKRAARKMFNVARW